ncbi:M24 family metallopeptidase [Roseobacter sp. HKCCD9010]|uniref:M24 family metallopeptidase n=1 Tax=Rhodobacterales TaxID=204455 RepID=UPI0014923F3C|nr:MULTISPECIES: Xaa-Pro peptidase family protein [Rhodobacterales]MBF9050721.1 M24 family metallopeptidase [Rhodobacterales bacterium HKCCD4356]NNV11861.1 M24 family metallopeptidase [Roseobacter sp. HKCCD7357]NNV18012.1 M24 family metallopeptidase [Roseobacter sp. HKCCD8768]NNV26103.1 M24 family metallopeptidase [Roseobacter sp. HKCCD8192]NNV31739.1 M24 family metallopeptidase [Roseobacter sp. HKCCD9061]
MASYQDRMKKFQTLIEGRADLVFIPIGTDLDYLTGIHRDIPNYGRNLHPGMWLEGAWLAPGRAPVLTLPRMTVEYGAPDGLDQMDVRVLGDWDDPVEMVKGLLAEFGLPDAPRIATSDDAEAESLMELQSLRPDARFISATAILRELRVIKDADEIEKLREAGEITEKAFAAVVAQLKIGMTELDVVSEVDYQMKKHGSLGPSFTTSLYNTGPNHPLRFGAKLESWPRVLTAPVSVLFDFGAVHDGMCYDFGRTVSFGAPSDEQVLVHKLIMESQAAGIAALKAGEVTCEAVDKAARDVLDDAGYGHAFRHRLGHGIGWDVHEPPFLTKGDETLVQEGMIFTIEPSIFQDGGMSARVEDCIVARPGGGEALTKGFQDLIVVE